MDEAKFLARLRTKDARGKVANSNVVHQMGHRSTSGRWGTRTLDLSRVKAAL